MKTIICINLCLTLFILVMWAVDDIHGMNNPIQLPGGFHCLNGSLYYKTNALKYENKPVNCNKLVNYG